MGRLLALLSNLQHLGLLWLLACSGLSTFRPRSQALTHFPSNYTAASFSSFNTSRGVATKSKDAVQVSLRNPPDVINTSAFKISVKKIKQTDKWAYCKDCFFFTVRNRDIWFFGRHSLVLVWVHTVLGWSFLHLHKIIRWKIQFILFFLKKVQYLQHTDLNSHR